MKYFRIASIVVLLLYAYSAYAENLRVILYTPAVDLSASSDADKELFLAGLLPDNVVNSQAYQNATLAEKIQYARDNGYVTPYMIKKGLVPLVGSILTDKYDVLQNYVRLVSQGNRHVFFCLMERTGKLSAVKGWIDAYNVGKADVDKILYWYGDTEKKAFADLYDDEMSIAQTIAGKTLRYPAFYHLVPGGVLASQAFQSASLGEQYQYGLDQGYFTDTQPRMGTVEEAIANGVTIDAGVLQEYGVPIKLFEG